MKIDYPYIAAELDRIASLDYTQDMQEAARALAAAIRARPVPTTQVVAPLRSPWFPY